MKVSERPFGEIIENICNINFWEMKHKKNSRTRIQKFGESVKSVETVDATTGAIQEFMVY